MVHFIKYFMLLLVVANATFANPFLIEDSSSDQQILLKDIGILGLASHDIFSWDSKKEVSKENGRLDLSTVFANDKDGNLIDHNWYAAGEWQSGGNKKNSENAPVYSITQLVISRFKTYLFEHGDPDKARRCVVKDFHEALKASVERMIGIEYPSIAQPGTVTNQEQAAYRVFHDILPAYIQLDNGSYLKLTDPNTVQTMLSEAELNQSIAFYDGAYDAEYTEIETGAPWIAQLFGAPKIINLQQLDQEFIARYGQHFTQKSGLQALCDLASGNCDAESLSFIHHIKTMFKKAQCKFNQDQQHSINPWIPDHIECFE